MNLPDKREFGWTLKPLESASTTFQKLPTGQYELRIEHDTIRNVSTEMIRWWFENFINLTVTLMGKEYPAYHLWHPFDHISVAKVSASNGIILKEGDFVQINEAFQRKPEFALNDKAKVYYFREDGFGLKVIKGPFAMGKLLHRFRDVGGGVEYRSHLVAGIESGPLRGLINSRLLPKIMNEKKLKAWFVHNIEEVGCFENFLADLYQRRSQGNKINLD
ncbi:MAG: hypothetical protein HN922_10315 [Anaerolineae bacterium]|jgi:hypothetical protein|nr:hypothetical protein [Anaerolineae bacterium]